VIGVAGNTRQLAVSLKNNDLLSTSAAVTVGTWAWVCVSYTAGAGAQMYVDGSQLTFSGTVPSTAIWSSGTIVIGQESDGSVSTSGFSSFDNTAFWIGAVGQVRVYRVHPAAVSCVHLTCESVAVPPASRCLSCTDRTGVWHALAGVDFQRGIAERRPARLSPRSQPMHPCRLHFEPVDDSARQRDIQPIIVGGPGQLRQDIHCKGRPHCRDADHDVPGWDVPRARFWHLLAVYRRLLRCRCGLGSRHMLWCVSGGLLLCRRLHCQ
jgi:hypothetical protein